MRYTEFIGRVEQRAAGGLGPDRAQQATRAVLRALAECLPAGGRRSIAAQLPGQLQASLRGGPADGAPCTTAAFLDRVAEQEGLSRSEAFDHTRAVFDVLGEAVTSHELEQLRSQLPDDFDALFKPPAVAKWPETHAPRQHR